MRIFKPHYNAQDGTSRQTSKWYVEFRDHNESLRRLSAFTSRSATEELARNLTKLINYHSASGGQSDPTLTRWLSELPQRTLSRLVEIGLVDRERVAVSKPLSDHLEEFKKSLQAKGCTDRHVELVTNRAKRVLDSCGFRFCGDISASKVMNYLHEMRADTSNQRGISAQTFNFYLQAIKQFCRWMVKDRRASESPVAHLDGLNVKTDRRHDRRTLTVEDLRRLLEATQGGPDRRGMTGPERAMLYRLAVETGLRAGELRSLTRASFDLRGDSPTVTVAAAYSKRRREDTLPLRDDLADDLRSFMRTMAPATQVFKVPKHTHSAEMFRADLEAAEIRYRDDAGKVADFHSLRHTFISNLAAGGVHPKVAQSLARHSTITLTMDRYTHSYYGEQATALEMLPDLSPPDRNTKQATGTDSADPRLKNLARHLSQKHGRGETSGDFGILSRSEEAGSSGNEKSSTNKDLAEKNRAKSTSRRGARAAEGAGLENRCGACVTVGSNPTLSVLHSTVLCCVLLHRPVLDKGLSLSFLSEEGLLSSSSSSLPNALDCTISRRRWWGFRWWCFDVVASSVPVFRFRSAGITERSGSLVSASTSLSAYWWV